MLTSQDISIFLDEGKQRILKETVGYLMTASANCGYSTEEVLQAFAAYLEESPGMDSAAILLEEAARSIAKTDKT